MLFPYFLYKLFENTLNYSEYIYAFLNNLKKFLSFKFSFYSIQFPSPFIFKTS